MRVERSDHQISGSIGTDEDSALKSVKSSTKSESTNHVAKESIQDPADKSSAQSKERSEVQHQNLGNEAKKEVLISGQIREAQLRAMGTGKMISGSPEILLPPDSTVRKEIDSVIDKGKEIAASGGEAIRNKAEELIGKGAEKLQGVQKEADQLDEKMDPEKAVDKLKNEGDKYSITVGGSGGAPIEGIPLKGALKGNAELTKEKDGYKLTLDGEVAASLVARKMGVEAGAATGAKVELTFKTPEEAKEAIRNLKQVVDVPDNQFQAGGLKLNTKAVDELSKQVKSIEVRGGAFAQGVLEQKGAVGSGELSTLFAKGQVKTDGAVRLEFENGKPSKLVLKATAQGEMAGGIGSKPGAGSVQVNTGVESSASGKATVTVEHEIPLSSNADSKTILEAMKSGDPNKLKSADPEAFKKWAAQNKFKLTISTDSKIDHVGTGVGAQSEVSFSVNADYFKKNERAIRQIVNQGPNEQNVRSLGDEIEVEGKFQTYRYTGVKWTPGITVGESEAGIELGYSQQEVLQSASITKKKNSTMQTEIRQVV